MVRTNRRTSDLEDWEANMQERQMDFSTAIQVPQSPRVHGPPSVFLESHLCTSLTGVHQLVVNATKQEILDHGRTPKSAP